MESKASHGVTDFGRFGLRSIRSRLSLLVLVASAGVGCAVGAVTLKAARNLFVEQSHAVLTNYSQALASEIDDIADKAGNSLMMARHDAAIDRYFTAEHRDPAAQAAALSEIQNRLLYINKTFAIDEVCLIAASGREVARVSMSRLAADEELSPDETSNPFFVETSRLDHEAIYRSVVPYKSPDTHELAIAHATPIILNDGRRAGILHFEIPLRWFADKLQSVVPDGGAAFLIAEDGSLLYAPTELAMNLPALANTDEHGFTRFASATAVGTETFRELAKTMLQARSGTGRYHDGKQYHEVVYRPVFNGHWLLATSLPHTQILTPYDRLLHSTVLIATPIAGVALLLMLYYAGRMLRPVRQLTESMQQLALGDLCPEVYVQRRDELGEMAIAFNQMVNFQRGMAITASAIAEGNLETNFRPASEHDELGLAFVRMIASLTRMLGDIGYAEARFRSLIQNIRDVVFILDSQGVILYANPAIKRITDQEPDAVLGKSLAELIHADDRPRLAHALEESLAASRHASTELRLSNGLGDWNTCEFVTENLLDEPAVGGIIATFHDITERKRYEDRLSHQALHDRLTSLANRALFQDRLQLAMARRSRHDAMLGVVLIDLDNFKMINDSLGHKCGDTMLLEAANRIRDAVRGTDTVGRLGGDEFAVLLDDCGSSEDGIEVVERILATMRTPTTYDGREIFLSCSIGVAFSHLSDERAEDLLANADMAMYKAKGKGKGQYAVFDDDLGQNVLQRLELESGLRHAIERNELEVYYQPIVTLKNEQICEVEALIRWNHPERGQVSPVTFIPIAEESGLILPIGEWVLNRACADVNRWNQELGLRPPVIVNVNLSIKQFQCPTLIQDITRILSETGLPAECLKLEITESMMMYDTQTTVEILWKLRKLGIKLAIDDFGTGYSSLSYLKSLPIDLLKIDRSFVRGLSNSTEDNAIVQAIIAMAKSLGIRVTAEGIETKEQAQELKSLHCDQGQGYLYARPAPAAAMEPLLVTHRQQTSFETEPPAARVAS